MYLLVQVATVSRAQNTAIFRTLVLNLRELLQDRLNRVLLLCHLTEVTAGFMEIVCRRL